jgi:hypothetical protein
VGVGVDRAGFVVEDLEHTRRHDQRVQKPREWDPDANDCAVR